MMKKILLVSILLIVSMFMFSCDYIDLSQFTTEDLDKIIVCDGDYIRYETGCCLDQNSDKVCDDDDEIVAGRVIEDDVGLLVPGSTCEDVDGNDGYKKSQLIYTTPGGAVTVKTDECVGNDKVLEFVCNGDEYHTYYKQCSFGCKDGACIKEDNICGSDICSNYDCGTVTDECDDSIDCGSCSSGYNCEDNVCVEEEIADICDPIECGSNDCGIIDNECDSTINCGSCSSGYNCENSLCVEEEVADICDPIECTSNQCEIIDNECDSTINCGSCSSGYNCENNVCVEEEEYTPISSDFALSIIPSKESYLSGELVSGEYSISYNGDNFEAIEVKCFSRSGYSVNFCHKNNEEYLSNNNNNEDLRAFELYGSPGDPYYTWPLDYFNGTGTYTYWIGIYIRSDVEEQLDFDAIHWGDLPERIAELTPIVSAEKSVDVIS
jgi:hypothetical protein